MKRQQDEKISRHRVARGGSVASSKWRGAAGVAARAGRAGRHGSAHLHCQHCSLSEYSLAGMEAQLSCSGNASRIVTVNVIGRGRRRKKNASRYSTGEKKRGMDDNRR